MSHPVPDAIPGVKVQDPEQLEILRTHLANICHLSPGSSRFPGSQPVSFTTQSLELLQSEDFWVCEKSDGVRVLVLILATTEAQEVYLVDRKDEFYQNWGFAFPKPDNVNEILYDTVLDAELVIDVDRESGKHILRLHAFDLLVFCGQNLMRAKPLTSRYGRLGEWVVKPYQAFLASRPDIANKLPFDLRVKKMEKAYGIEAVVREQVPNLEHGSDGLIFTAINGPYIPGTDEKILKWKPPYENSIDFRLELRFPALESSPMKPDLAAKPQCRLMMNCGRDAEQLFDYLEVTDAQWDEMRNSRIQYDDRVVECVWDAGLQTWKILRFRDDKREGNYKDIVDKILISIRDGVEQQMLIDRAGMIKHNWKAREAGHRASARPQPQQLRPAPQAQAYAPHHSQQQQIHQQQGLQQPIPQQAQSVANGGSQYYVPAPAQVFQTAPPPDVPGRKALRL